MMGVREGHFRRLKILVKYDNAFAGGEGRERGHVAWPRGGRPRDSSHPYVALPPCIRCHVFVSPVIRSPDIKDSGYVQISCVFFFTGNIIFPSFFIFFLC